MSKQVEIYTEEMERGRDLFDTIRQGTIAELTLTPIPPMSILFAATELARAAIYATNMDGNPELARRMLVAWRQVANDPQLEGIET